MDQRSRRIRIHLLDSCGAVFRLPVAPVSCDCKIADTRPLTPSQFASIKVSRAIASVNRNLLPPRIPPPQLELLQRYLPPWTASLAILPWEDRDACSARGNLWSPVRLMSYPIACVAEYWKSCACFTQRDNGRLNLKSKFSC